MSDARHVFQVSCICEMRKHHGYGYVGSSYAFHTLLSMSVDLCQLDSFFQSYQRGVLGTSVVASMSFITETHKFTVTDLESSNRTLKQIWMSHKHLIAGIPVRDDSLGNHDTCGCKSGHIGDDMSGNIQMALHGHCIAHLATSKVPVPLRKSP